MRTFDLRRWGAWANRSNRHLLSRRCQLRLELLEGRALPSVAELLPLPVDAAPWASEPLVETTDDGLIYRTCGTFVDSPSNLDKPDLFTEESSIDLLATGTEEVMLFGSIPAIDDGETFAESQDWMSICETGLIQEENWAGEGAWGEAFCGTVDETEGFFKEELLSLCDKWSMGDGPMPLDLGDLADWKSDLIDKTGMMWTEGSEEPFEVSICEWADQSGVTQTMEDALEPWKPDATLFGDPSMVGWSREIQAFARAFFCGMLEPGAQEQMLTEEIFACDAEESICFDSTDAELFLMDDGLACVDYPVVTLEGDDAPVYLYQLPPNSDQPMPLDEEGMVALGEERIESESGSDEIAITSAPSQPSARPAASRGQEHATPRYLGEVLNAPSTQSGRPKSERSPEQIVNGVIEQISGVTGTPARPGTAAKAHSPRQAKSSLSDDNSLFSVPDQPF